MGGDHVNTVVKGGRGGSSAQSGRGVEGGEKGHTRLFSHRRSENEHVSQGDVWDGASASQASLLLPPPLGTVEERRPTCRRQEEDVFFFRQVSSGHHQRENQR